LGEANVVAGVADGDRVRTDLGTLPADWAGGPPGAGGAAVVLVRPEQLALVEPGTDGVLTGEITEYQYFGHDAVARIRPDRPCGPGGGADPLVVRVPGGIVLRPGARTGVVAVGKVRAWAGEGTAEQGSTSG